MRDRLTPAADTSTGAGAGWREWTGLFVLMLPVLLISVDMTVLGFAVPKLSADLDPSSTQLLWIVDIYSFVLAGLLVTMGNLGDRIGRRRLLMIGCVGFGVASLVAAYAPDAATLIAARALLGVAGATLMPSTLSLLRNMFVDERQRLLAVAAWGSAFSAGSALGPLIGGWLLEHFWWGSVFLINLPVVAVALLALPLLVPETRDPAPGRFDLPSAALSLLTMLPVVYGIKTLAKRETPLLAVTAIAAGLIFGYLFVRRQRTITDPMIDISLFRIRRFSGAVATNLLVVFALIAAMFFLPQYLQSVAGISPLRGGLLLLPGALLSIVAGFTAAATARRVGMQRLISAGITICALGFAVILLLPYFDGAVIVTVSFAITNVGAGLVMTLTNSIVLSAVPPARAGAAAAVSETGFELGGALGVAVLGSVLASTYAARLPDVPGVGGTAMDSARETIGGAVAVAAETSGTAGQALLDTARDAFTFGVQITSAVGAVLLAATAVQAWFLLRPGAGQPSAPSGDSKPVGDRKPAG
ncbi:MFS transporter [Polymorphospora rubra]|uniref:MFS transporter n=1 Tax=Polymorphospora rubra TaxID=338584 RepID=UPI0033CF18A6